MSQIFVNSEAPALSGTVPAGRVVFLTGSRTALAVDSTSSPLGVSFGSGVDGDYIDVVNFGSVMCDASGSIAAGSPVAASEDGDGRVVDVSTAALISGTQGSAWFVGTAQTDSSGGRVRVFVNPAFLPAQSNAE